MPIDHEAFFNWVLQVQPGLVERFINNPPKRIIHEDPNYLVGPKLPRPSSPIKNQDEPLPDLPSDIKLMAYTLVVTSCERHDLLQKTLSSFFATCDVQPRSVVIVEDSAAPKPAWLNELEWKARGVEWISNGRRIGQIYSIDRAYSRVRTEYIFHLEDDWEFTQGNYIRPSQALLEQFPEIIQVSLRGDSGWHTLVTDDKYPVSIAQPYWRGAWGGISFNPGLRRLADYRKLGSYGLHVGYDKSGLKHEEALSKKLLDQGFRIADFGKVIVRHTGDTRSRAVELIPALPKILIAVPACFKLEYGAWESAASPHFDPAKARDGKPYGVDIHISGANPRIAAVRDTWAKDTGTFPNVSVRFFYGKPEGGYPREPLPDEVFLDCPDDYAGLIRKTMAICAWAHAEHFDYLLKCDDDTGVYVDRLVHECLTFHPFHYGGWLHNGLATGGPGYWLSHKAMGLVAGGANGQPDPTAWAEDMYTGKCVVGRPHGVGEGLMLQNHRPGFADHWFFRDGYDPERDMADIVTFHAVQPEVMRDWYKHERS